MKTLAVVGIITEVRAIKGADFIQSAVVDCGTEGEWEGVVKKDLTPDTKVLVCLQDAIVPNCERFAFMESKKFRVKMCKFKGVPSECLIVPLLADESVYDVGDNLTEILGVIKYEKTVEGNAMKQGQSAGNFFQGIPKTDEENYQKMPWQELLDSNEDVYATIKYDGSSCTALVDESGLRVASRNFERKEFTSTGVTNGFWQAARKYKLENMPVGACIQFEVVGPGVQKNPMGLNELEIRVFGLFLQDSWDTWRKQPRSALEAFCETYGLPASERVTLPPIASKDDLRALVDIVKYPNGAQAEGIVFGGGGRRSENGMWSFKVISLNYKY